MRTPVLIGIILLLVGIPASAVDICVTLPAGQAARIVTAAASNQGYVATLPDPSGTPIPNPQTAPQFLRQKFRDFIVNAAREGEMQAAASAAAATAQTSIDTATAGVQ